MNNKSILWNELSLEELTYFNGGHRGLFYKMGVVAGVSLHHGLDFLRGVWDGL